MADDMMQRGVFPLFCGAALAAAASVAAAPLADPTQPPSAAVYPGGVGSDGGRRLTSVVLPNAGRPAAVIGGQLVPLGGKVGDARLVRVTENEAVLAGPDGRERLFLTPDVTKKMNVTKAAARRNKE